MGKSPPRQHYVSKCLMKQWAGDDGRVGVICLLHRWSGTVSVKALNWHKNLTSEPEKIEKEWSQTIEYPAGHALQKIADASQTPNSGQIDAIRDVVKGFGTLDALIGLVALHASRSIATLLLGFQRNSWQSPPNPSETLDDIKKRHEHLLLKYRQQGVVLRVYDTPAPVLLSQLPVYDADDWSGVDDPILGAAQVFQMPLNPRGVLYGDPARPTGTVSVEPTFTDGKGQERQNWFEWWPIGDIHRLTSPLVICSVEQADRLGPRVLQLTTGNAWCWLGIHNRMRANHQQGIINDSTYEDITARCALYHNRLRELSQTLGRNPNSRRILVRWFNRWIARELRVVETKLNEALSEVESPSECSCNYFYKNSDFAFWRTLIPEVVCQQANRSGNPAQHHSDLG